VYLNRGAARGKNLWRERKQEGTPVEQGLPSGEYGKMGKQGGEKSKSEQRPKARRGGRGEEGAGEEKKGKRIGNKKRHLVNT